MTEHSHCTAGDVPAALDMLIEDGVTPGEPARRPSPPSRGNSSRGPLIDPYAERNRQLSEWRRKHLHSKTTGPSGDMTRSDGQRQAMRQRGTARKQFSHDDRMTARRLCASPGAPKVRGCRPVTPAEVYMGKTHCIMMHSPFQTGSPNVEMDTSGQLKKEGIRALSEEYGVRQDIVQILNRTGCDRWRRRRAAAERAGYRRTLEAGLAVHPATISKVIMQAEASSTTPPAPSEFYELQKMHARNERKLMTRAASRAANRAASSAARAVANMQERPGTEGGVPSEEEMRRTPIRGHLTAF